MIKSTLRNLILDCFATEIASWEALDDCCFVQDLFRCKRPLYSNNYLSRSGWIYFHSRKIIYYKWRLSDGDQNRISRKFLAILFRFLISAHTIYRDFRIVVSILDLLELQILFYRAWNRRAKCWIYRKFFRVFLHLAWPFCTKHSYSRDLASVLHILELQIFLQQPAGWNIVSTLSRVSWMVARLETGCKNIWVARFSKAPSGCIGLP